MEFSNLRDFGNFVITGLSGVTLDDKDKRILEEIGPAGILFLKRNLLQNAAYEEWHEAFANLISQIKRYSGREKILLTIDHEGGQVQRAPEPISNFGRPERYAKSAAEVARAMALELKSMGINLSWAPSADINTNPANPIIGKLGRSFSSSPEEVAKTCVEFHKAMAGSGILTCAKHYPGHGDTWSDSHLELPVVDVTEEELFKRELVPFKALVEAGVPTVMTAHVLFKNIDTKDPATFSRKIINEFLREKLGFKGVIIADDINMLAIYDRIRSLEGAAQTINAGIDTYIVGRFPEPEKDESPLILCKNLMEALNKGLIATDALAAARTRVDDLLQKTPMYQPALIEKTIFARHRTLADTLNA